MIYIASNNLYLCEGVKGIMYPIKVKRVSTKNNFSEALSAMDSTDVLLLDSNFSYYALDGCQCCSEQPLVIILNHSRNQTAHLNGIDFFYHTLNISVSIPEFQAYILAAATGRLGRKLFNVRLTSREAFVFRESLKGLTVKEIAGINGIPEKSVYAQRLSACRKLGFESPRVIWTLPIRLWADHATLRVSAG